MLVGYLRVSTKEQRLDAQRDRLVDAGCEKFFSDVASGARADRPALMEALEFVRPGDVLVCTKLDRIARSLRHLVDVAATLEGMGVGMRSLSEQIDSTSPGGRLVFNLFGAVGQFELDLIRERTRAGLAAAKRRGRVGGRPRLMTDAKARAARNLLAAGQSPRDVASTLGVSVSTLYRHCPASVPAIGG